LNSSSWITRNKVYEPDFFCKFNLSFLNNSFACQIEVAFTKTCFAGGMIAAY